jgi:PPOX class probable FMN-dependent enzyme
MVGTSGADGRCDVSPRGDGPGFALVLDERTIVLPERPGNKRADTLGNIIDNPRIGVIFLVPGIEETLRVNGRAGIVQDEWLLDRLITQGKTPKLAIVVEIEEAYFHCAKAFRRARLWDVSTHAAKGELATFGKILVDQFGMTNCSPEEMDERLQEGYRTTLY